MENKLPQFFFVTADEHIEKTLPNYRLLLNYLGESNPIKFLQTILATHMSTYQEISSSKIREVYKNMMKGRNRKKKRWVASVRKSVAENAKKVRKKEMLYYKEHINKEYMEIGPVKFSMKYGTDSIEEHLVNFHERLDEWAKSKEPTTQYPLFEYIDDGTKVDEITESILIELLGYLIEAYGADIRSIIEERPDFLINKPITNASNKKNYYKFNKDIVEQETPSSFGFDESEKLDINAFMRDDEDEDDGGRKKIPREEINQLLGDDEGKLDKKRFKTSIYETDDFMLQTLVTEAYTMQKVVRYMEDTDFSILGEILKQLDETYMRDRNVYVDLNKITRSIYGKRSSRTLSKTYYEDVRSRIIKIANLYFNFIEKETNTVYGFNLFSRYKEVPTPSGNYMVVTLSEALIDDLNKYNTTRLYKIELDRLRGNPLAKTLTYALQKIRIDMHMHNLGAVYKCNYKYFLAQAQFTERKKNDLYKQIEHSLDAIVNAGIVVESYKRNGEQFTIQFVPVREYEIEDLVKINREKMIIDSPQKNI